jgi:hypothetical protein
MKKKKSSKAKNEEEKKRKSEKEKKRKSDKKQQSKKSFLNNFNFICSKICLQKKRLKKFKK